MDRLVSEGSRSRSVSSPQIGYHLCHLCALPTHEKVAKIVLFGDPSSTGGATHKPAEVLLRGNPISHRASQ